MKAAREIPKLHEVWQHQKHYPQDGKQYIYVIVGIATPSKTFNQESYDFIGTALHVTTNNEFKIFRCGDECMALSVQDHKPIEERCIIYASMHDDKA